MMIEETAPYEIIESTDRFNVGMLIKAKELMIKLHSPEQTEIQERACANAWNKYLKDREPLVINKGTSMGKSEYKAIK